MCCRTSRDQAARLDVVVAVHSDGQGPALQRRRSNAVHSGCIRQHRGAAQQPPARQRIHQQLRAGACQSPAESDPDASVMVHINNAHVFKGSVSLLPCHHQLRLPDLQDCAPASRCVRPPAASVTSSSACTSPTNPRWLKDMPHAAPSSRQRCINSSVGWHTAARVLIAVLPIMSKTIALISTTKAASAAMLMRWWHGTPSCTAAAWKQHVLTARESLMYVLNSINPQLVCGSSSWAAC